MLDGPLLPRPGATLATLQADQIRDCLFNGVVLVALLALDFAPGELECPFLFFIGWLFNERLYLDRNDVAVQVGARYFYLSGALFCGAVSLFQWS